MENGTKKTIIWENNTEPPKNYIWGKADGKFYEYNGSAWAESEDIKSTANIAVTGVSLNKSTASISVSGNTTLKATVTPSDASDTTVTWITSDAGVATVNGSGKVTGVAEGTAVITAAIGGHVASCEVTVA